MTWPKAELPSRSGSPPCSTCSSRDPNQPVYLEELATLLAGVGLSEESLPWYAQAIGVITRSSGTRPPEFHNLLIDYAAEQMIAGHSSAADTLLGQMLDELPLDPDAWFLKLSIGQSSAGPVAYKQTLELARSAMVRRWNAVADEILNGPAATQPATGAQPPPAGAQQPDAGAAQTQPAATEPAAVAPLDPEPIIEKLKTGSEQQKRSFFFVVADLAWFELYFDKQPDAAKKWIDALATTPVETRRAGSAPRVAAGFSRTRPSSSRRKPFSQKLPTAMRWPSWASSAPRKPRQSPSTSRRSPAFWTNTASA